METETTQIGGAERDDPTLDDFGRRFGQAVDKWLARPRGPAGKLSLRAAMESQAAGIKKVLAAGGTYDEIAALMKEAGIANPSRGAVSKYAAELGIGRRKLTREARSGGQAKAAKPATTKASVREVVQPEVPNAAQAVLNKAPGQPAPEPAKPQAAVTTPSLGVAPAPQQRKVPFGVAAQAEALIRRGAVPPPPNVIDADEPT